MRVSQQEKAPRGCGAKDKGQRGIGIKLASLILTSAWGHSFGKNYPPHDFEALQAELAKVEAAAAVTGRITSVSVTGRISF